MRKGQGLVTAPVIIGFMSQQVQFERLSELCARWEGVGADDCLTMGSRT